MYSRSLKIAEALEVQMEVQKKLYEQIEVTFINYDQYSFQSRLQVMNKNMLISLKHDFRCRNIYSLELKLKESTYNQY